MIQIKINLKIMKIKIKTKRIIIIIKVPFLPLIIIIPNCLNIFNSNNIIINIKNKNKIINNVYTNNFNNNSFLALCEKVKNNKNGIYDINPGQIIRLLETNILL